MSNIGFFKIKVDSYTQKSPESATGYLILVKC